MTSPWTERLLWAAVAIMATIPMLGLWMRP
jgi:hypothetical protein